MSLSLAETTAILTGEAAVLDEITELAVPVDVSGIREKTTQKVTIPVADGLSVDPDEVPVTITPRLATSSLAWQQSPGKQSIRPTPEGRRLLAVAVLLRKAPLLRAVRRLSLPVKQAQVQN